MKTKQQKVREAAVIFVSIVCGALTAIISGEVIPYIDLTTIVLIWALSGMYWMFKIVQFLK
jgi:hypothetical protein